MTKIRAMLWAHVSASYLVSLMFGIFLYLHPDVSMRPGDVWNEHNAILWEVALAPAMGMLMCRSASMSVLFGLFYLAALTAVYQILHGKLIRSEPVISI
jgi:hypothetical protein